MLMIVLEKRGGLESIPYGDQILRVRYSGAEMHLKEITSIEIVWTMKILYNKIRINEDVD